MSVSPASWLWSLQSTGELKMLPPCAGTITSEHGLCRLQPRNEFSCAVSNWIGVEPSPLVLVDAYAVFIGPYELNCPAMPPLEAPKHCVHFVGCRPLHSATITG